MQIERETWEAWIESQPPDRLFDYMDNANCAVCCFVRETTSFSDIRAGSDYVRNGHVRLLDLPQWLSEGVLMVVPLTIANMKRRYIELFGDPNPIPLRADGTPDLEAILNQK